MASRQDDGYPAAVPARDRTINYVELHVADLPAAKRFYGDAFGWGFTDYGPHYASFSASDAGLDGGLWQDTPDEPAPPRGGNVLVVLYAQDLEATQAKIESAGGRITKPTFDFPGGRRFHFVDPAGNELAAWSE